MIEKIVFGVLNELTEFNEPERKLFSFSYPKYYEINHYCPVKILV
jgi:hypothetical protein